MKALLQFFSGKKTYFLSVGVLIYAAGIHFGWWSHQPDFDLMFGGAGAMTIRAAIKKLCLQIAADPALNEPAPSIRPGDRLMQIAIAFALLPALLFSSCSKDDLHQAGQNAVAVVTSPAGQAALKVVGTVALGAALNAGDQYFNNGHVNGKQVAGAAYYGAAAQLRTLQGTGTAPSSAAIAVAINSGGGVPSATRQIAPVVTPAIASAISQGATPDAALETVAVNLEAAGARLSGGN